MNAEIIIARCTRNGVTAWQAVALQLGVSVDKARCDHDPSYLKVRPWPHACEAVTPEPEVDIEDMSSPYVKGPGLKALILTALQHGPMSAETLASTLIRPVNSIRARLDRLTDDFLVCNDGRFPRSWSLTAKGLRVAVTGCEIRPKERV